MEKNSEVNKLREIYCEMDAKGKKNMMAAAAELLSVQKNLEDTRNVTNALNQNRAEEPQRRSFAGILKGNFGFYGLRWQLPGYLMTGLFLLFIAYIFWTNLINPALMIDTTPLTMIWIVITAFCGMFCIGAGLIGFILNKLAAPWMVFAIGAGLLCLDPRAFTDFIGIIFAVLIITMQIIQGKQEKAAMAE